ncbi:hypothetical protein [Streptomyces sp. NPDC091383]|uniref:hypothetical protein n=1 Tax=Streptomyces sp. NPDC091383 TaxID=3365996 RepID=UPI00381C1D0E
MRLRLRNAIQALLADPSIAGQKDVARLAAVVLYAKSRAPMGERNDNQTSIWVAELGRWLGVGESSVHRNALAPLKKSDGLHTKVVRNSEGHPTGLECLVMPLWRARKGGGVGHPLALSKAELATLLHLCEALFGPGWAPEGKEPTPPGLLAGRRGKGAATDRLGLLLMVLNTRASGWLQLVGGSVKKREGRGAATLARLLGCSASGARKVLARLTEAGVVARRRKATSTRMNGRGKVMLLPVARAYGRTLASVEAAQSTKSVFSARPDGACGDHAPAAAAGARGTSGIGGAEGAGDAADRERPDGAEFHADHASGVTAVVPPQLSRRFSGEGRGGEDRLPERVCAGKDQPADSQAAVAGTGKPVAEGGPLRGEKPKESRVDERGGQRAAGAKAGGWPKAVGWDKTQQQRRVGLPARPALQVALGPVAGLWARLSGWQQDQVQAAAEAEIKRLEGLLEHQGGGPRLLADRLTDRLEETGGDALVDRPFPWLMRRGLVQRQACSDCRCDDRIRLDSRGDCPTCATMVADRRAHRARLRVVVDSEFADADVARRRAVYEARLREHTALEAGRSEARHTQAVIEVAQRRAAADRRRQAEASAELARRSAPCAECGLPDAAGLCPQCTYQQRTDLLVQEAVDLAVAVRADLDDVESVAALSERCEADTRRLLDELVRRTGQPVVTDAAFTARQAAERIRDERRTSAYRRLLASEEAETEACAVYDSVLRQRPRGHQVAEGAAEEARHRTAEYLLRQKLGRLRVLRARAAAGRGPRRAG